MNIHFTSPFSKAFENMKEILFRPFDLAKWMVIGFAAFLATLLDGGGFFPAIFQWKDSNNWNNYDYGDFGFGNNSFNSLVEIWDWFSSNPIWFAVFLCAIVFLVILVVFLLWISSKGKFVFINNCIEKKGSIAAPWREYKRQGNSLFLWRLAFGIFTFILGVFIAIATISIFIEMRGMEFVELLPYLLVGGFLFFIIIVFFAYINLFLDHFVVPIMYKNRISTIQAWRKFLSLFSKNIWSFLGYGLFILLINTISVFFVLFVGFFTCCIGFIILAIPYISSVIILPYSITIRFYSLEFLKQFGEEYNLLETQNPENEEYFEH